MPCATPLDVDVSWHAAPAGLQPLVLGVVVWRFRSPGPHWVPVPAHALATLTVVAEGSLHADIGDIGDIGDTRDAGALPAVLGGGPLTQAQGLWAHGPGRVATVLCRASVLPMWTGEAASVFRDGAVPLAVWGVDDDPGRWQAGPTRQAPSAPALAAALMAHVARRLDRSTQRATARRFTGALAQWRHELDAAVQAGRRMPLQPGGWSERQWQRACQAELGVGPKLLHRLVRLHGSTCTIDAAAAGEAAHGAVLAHVAAQAGYADQAHMSREYRDLAGCAPGTLRGGSPRGADTPARPGAATLSATLSARLVAPAFFGS